MYDKEKYIPFEASTGNEKRINMAKKLDCSAVIFWSIEKFRIQLIDGMDFNRLLILQNLVLYT